MVLTAAARTLLGVVDRALPDRVADLVPGLPGRRARGGRDLKVVIIGCGFSGIAAAIAMQDAGRGHEVLIVEAADEIGGTWRDNTYPGCACDIPSPVYSLHGHPHRWTQFFAPQPEIQAYLRKVVDQRGLRGALRLGTRIVRQTWVPSTATWLLETHDGDVILADVVINAVGPLTEPVVPDLPGRDDFDGPSFHTARWRSDVDLAGQRVAVVGTGASAVQVVPEIVGDVAALHVVQRTAPWVLPKPDRQLSWLERTALGLPGVHQLVREVTHQALEQGLWRMVQQDPRALERLRGAGRWNVRRAIEDPVLRAAVTPDIEVGCKRLLFSNTYYPALARPHVTVHPSGAAALTPTGVVTGAGDQLDVDVVIWATGFDPHRFWGPMEVEGQDGVTLDERWATAPLCHNSIAAPGLPNAFFLLGPNSGTGHNSVVLMAEAQAGHVVQALDVLRHGEADWIAPRESAARAYGAEMARRHADLVWASGCGSWYLDDDGDNHVLYPGTVTDYQRRMRRFDVAAWELGRRTGREGDRTVVEGPPLRA